MARWWKAWAVYCEQMMMENGWGKQLTRTLAGFIQMAFA
jgi:hypothetical protein